MSTSVKLYTSEQAGAPQASNAAGTLVAILDACLVNGFGLAACTITVADGVATVNTGANAHSALRDGVMLIAGATPAGLNGQKRVLQVVSSVAYTFAAPGVPDGTATGTITQRVAPAGWERPYTGTNAAVYRSADTTGPRAFYEVVDTATADYALVRGFENMTALGTGEGRFPSVEQTDGSYWLRSGAGGVKWVLVATERTVYFCQGLGGGSAWPRGQLYHFGEIASLDGSRDGWVSTISGGVNSSPGGTIANHGDNRFWAARSPVTGLPGAARLINASMAGGQSGATGVHPYPNPVGAALLLDRVSVFDDPVSGPRARLGWLPGLAHIPQQIAEANLLAPLYVDGAGSLAGRRVMILPVQAWFGFAAVGLDITGPWY